MGTDSGGVGRAGRRQKHWWNIFRGWNPSQGMGRAEPLKIRKAAGAQSNYKKAEGQARVRPKVIKIKVGHQRTSADEDPSRRALAKKK